MRKPFKCAFYAILLSAPVWVAMIWLLIRYRIFGIVLISIMMAIFILMAMMPFINPDYGKQND